MAILSDVLIEDNTILYGNLTTDGTTITSYGYNNCLINTADSLIQGNTFIGINANSGNFMASLGGGNCVVQNNRFIRGTNVIGAYISSLPTLDHIIQNNYFDGYTVDNVSNEALVTGLSLSSIYRENKNQSGYMPIQKAHYLIAEQIFDPPNLYLGEYAKYVDDGSFAISTGAGAKEGIAVTYGDPFVRIGSPPTSGSFQVLNGNPIVTCNFTIGGVQDFGKVIIKFDTDDTLYNIASSVVSGTTVTQLTLETAYIGFTTDFASATIYNQPGGDFTHDLGLTPTNPTVRFGFSIDINNVLPPNVQVLSMVFGVTTPDATHLVGGQYFGYTYASYPGDYQLSSLSGSMADIKNFTLTATDPSQPQYQCGFTIGTGGGQIPPASFSTASQYMQIDLTAPSAAPTLSLFTTGKGRRIPFNWFAEITVSHDGSTFMYESPLIVKYRW